MIDSAKTHITGKTTIEEGVIDTAYIKDAAITSAKIKDITADKIKAGEVSGLILTSLSETGRFSVEGQHATLENTDTGWKTDIYDNGIYTYNPDHSLRARFTEDMVNSNKFGTSTYNVYLATGGMDGVEGESAGGEVRAVLYTQNIEDGEDVGSKYEYTYRPFRGEGMVGSYVNLNTAIPGSNNMYLRVPSGKEVKITRIGTVDDFQDIRANDGYFASIMQESSDAGNFYIGANGEVRMTSRGGYNGDATVYRDIRAQDARIASILQKDSGTNFYLGTGGKLRVTSRAGYNDGDTKYKAVEASGFENKSIADIKTDITKRQEKALTCVNATDVYNYKLKDDVSRGITKNHIGLIIGDGYNTPDCVKNDDGTAIDVYAMTSVAWKAIQELSDKNETLNNRISDLQSEIDILRKETTI
ncbi:tail fiber domain-containing protein [Tetragenococcus halophilus]|uniref:tail fiber domain-containing protein n=1 Tax=Tetragenococcus halophilus TaxID=51669 RepID=UPI00077C27E6|nr:tail fiber domain-containing protein [Tetragenococcus halophilus]